ncbi:DUF4245 domain-containing protein [[Mycobacterium] nativiensis]|uniref:DUF4245 domain-containing protein n=1 Tax=[Mycobacterium] nativiensis TaxID=2855503 RepID=A0ABU5XUA1_9MYCO|nr:DUF4245 domain-containing protein [Mycolicibacter sp. MYC340]MEB3031513.1 DUF4245 domain-containing protein [Mycolicibacter sp. MYC340]
MTSEPQPPTLPAPRPAKPRLLQDGRDMFWSIAPLVLACIVLAGLAGTCSFNPGGNPTGPVPSYDAVAALNADAQTFGFPVRLPHLPEGWQPNSGGRGSITDGHSDSSGQRLRAVTSRVGYISPTGMYISLTQSNADEVPLVASLSPALHPTGTEDVDGATWVVYEGDGQPVWTTRLTSKAGPVQLAITGAGSVDEFRTLAAATQSQAPLPPKQ